MMRGIGLACACVLAGAGCAPTPAMRMRGDMQTVANERTPDKLIATARAMALLGDSVRAEQYLLAAMESADDDATERRVMPLLLATYVRDKQYRAAIDCAENTLRKHPDDDRLRFLLGALYQGVGQDASAIEQFGRVVVARPGDAEAHFALGVLLREESRNLDAAQAQFREYLRLEPGGRHADEARESLLEATP